MPAVIENPAAVMLAYRYAEKLSAHGPAGKRVRVAHARWADDQSPLLGSLSPYSGALAIAEAYGVGAQFFVGAAQVTEDAALASAAEELGEQATPADEAYVTKVLNTIKANAGASKDAMMKFLDDATYYAPSRVAQRAVTEAGASTIDMLQEAAKETKEAVKTVYEDHKDLPEQGLKTMSDMAKAGGDYAKGVTVWGVAAIVAMGLGALWYFGPKK